MSSASPAGLDASRPRSGILTPSSDGSLNRNNEPLAASPHGHKRKRSDAVAMDHLLKPSISVKPHPTTLQAQPRFLQPLMVVPRKHLPLSFIDLQSPQGDLSSSRFFESHIKILDLESRMASSPSLLIARSDSKGSTYAVERQSNGLYVVCKIGAWVDLRALAEKATVLLRERVYEPSKEHKVHDAPATITTPQLHKTEKNKRAAIEAIQSLVRKRARSQSVANFEEQPTPSEAPATESVQGNISSPHLQEEVSEQSQPRRKAHVSDLAPHAQDDNTLQQSTDHIFDNIRLQYSEALYKSKGSLAYFAKGPLSRARSAFHLDLEANLNMSDLIDFLRNMILTTIQTDKKYRETLPAVISKMKASADTSDEGRKKRRKLKKMKVGRDGLYPHETDKIETWWIANKPELTGEESSVPEPLIKSHLSLLRTRETQLQMIVILEILALESLRSANDGEEATLPTLPGAGAAESQDRMGPPPVKKRNKHNLPVLLDVHADRLTIWQSTASDEQLLLEDSQVVLHLPDGQPAQKVSSEPLKDFCVDVIVPFFSARLPELCDGINRKLGGPIIVSPPKSKASRRSSGKRDGKPGAGVRRPALGTAPPTLQRALSTEQQHRRSVSRGPSNMIALLRSATSTSLNGVKKESNEQVALSALPKSNSTASRGNHSVLSRSSSMTKLNDAKVDKKAQVEAELKEAISTLRKPNRGVVGQAMAEAAERRASTTSSAKKVKKPARSTLGSNVQVKATPANNRFRDVLGTKVESPPLLPTIEDVIPPSSVNSLVPSTGPRRGVRDAWPPGESPIFGTPNRSDARSSFLNRSIRDDVAIPPSSPLSARYDTRPEACLKATPVKSSGRLDLTSTPHSGTVLFQTPVRPTTTQSIERKGESGEQAPQRTMSIYEKLGWDDELDDI